MPASQAPEQPARRIIIGHINGVFGTRGWLKAYSYTRPRENLLNYAPLLLNIDGHWQAMSVNAAQRHHGGLILCLDGINDRDAAAKLVRAEIAIERSQLPAAAPHEYYWSDLIGLKVLNLAGDHLGELVEMLETGANDVMRVHGEDEYLIPFVTDIYVVAVDLSAGSLTVDWQPDF